MSDSEIPVSVQQAFDEVDGDNNGRIELDEFSELLDALSADMTPPDVEVAFDIIDVNNSGSISLAEFYRWWDGVGSDA